LNLEVILLERVITLQLFDSITLVRDNLLDRVLYKVHVRGVERPRLASEHTHDLEGARYEEGLSGDVGVVQLGDLLRDQGGECRCRVLELLSRLIL
jgi:hypothetical protein